MIKLRQRVWIPWAFSACLCLLCGASGLLQNRWLRELSNAEDARLHRDLQHRLDGFRSEFDHTINDAAFSLIPKSSDVRDAGVEKAFTAKAAIWKRAHVPYFSRIAIAIPADNEIRLIGADVAAPAIGAMEWPPEWGGLLARLRSRLNGVDVGPPRPANPDVLEIPIFDHNASAFVPQGWLLLELDVNFLRGNTVPTLLTRYLDEGRELQVQAEITSSRDSNFVIFRTTGDRDLTRRGPDATVDLLDFRDRRDNGPIGPPPEIDGRRLLRPHDTAFGRPGPEPQGRWRLAVRYSPGALESVIARARWENAGVSAGLLGLILATGAALVRYSRRIEKLARVQFNFVAGVSHELRTPVTVIRSAAYNLRHKVISRPDQLAQYSALIQDESERLSALVEQVLLFATSGSGAPLRVREKVSVEDLIEQSIRTGRAMHPAEVVIDRRVAPGLPPISVDTSAMQHAIHNLVANAIKYGTENSKWVGISAAPGFGADSSIEIRVTDNGPGIPDDEQKHIFEPFFRGDRPLRNQIHGTGLGLSLVRSIVEAHGGTVRVRSQPMRGAEFIMRLPVRSAT